MRPDPIRHHRDTVFLRIRHKVALGWRFRRLAITVVYGPKRILRSALSKVKTTILFYPEKPRHFTVMYKLCSQIGVRISNDPAKAFSHAIRWEDATCGTVDGTLREMIDNQVLLNPGLDISKSTLDQAHQKVFGYSLGIDPLAYTLPILRKSNANYSKDGVILANSDCDITDHRYVFQRLIDNRAADGHVVDMRVPVFGSNMPFVYLKFRKEKERFTGSVAKSEIRMTSELLSIEEQILIVSLCRNLRLDVCELDVLRDRPSGMIYVVDANNTPGGPPRGLGYVNYRLALTLLSEALRKLLDSGASPS